MNAFQLLPYALPFIALGTYGALRFARGLTRPSQPSHAIIVVAHMWHTAVVDRERAQGLYVHDGSITDINVDHGYVT